MFGGEHVKGACTIYTVFFVSYTCISTCQTEVAVVDQLGKCASTKAHESRRRVFILLYFPALLFFLLTLSLCCNYLRFISCTLPTCLASILTRTRTTNCPSSIIMAAPADITIKNLNGEWVLVC